MKLLKNIPVVSLIYGLLESKKVTAFLTLLLAVSVTFWAPHLVGVITFKLCLVTLAAMLGYWIDIILFSELKIVDLLKQHSNEMSNRGESVWVSLLVTAQIRRTVIILATILGVSLGL